ncbi:MAG: PAS domain S-box protein [Thermodesulfobacteriota bacterium]|nr:PAS domain S-box protein [Thermodesulfobacteriota bacterium]
MIEHIYQDIVETVREPLLVLDSNLKVVFANRSFFHSFAVTPETTLGNHIYTLGDKQWDIPGLRDLLENVLIKNEKFDGYEVEHEFQNIGHKIMLLNARRFSENDAGFEMILLAIEDITERKQRENSLKDSEEQFKRIFDTTSDGILLLDKQKPIVRYANPAITAMSGYSQEECIGKDIKDIGFPDDLDPFQEIVKRLNNDGIVHYNDVVIRMKSGQFIDADIFFVDKTSLVLCNIRDITERKIAENTILHAEQKYRKLFESIRDAILVTDIDRSIIDCNSAFTDIFGYAANEIKGKKTNYLYADAVQFQEMGNALKKHYGEAPFIKVVNYKKKDGEVFSGETGVYFLRNRKGEVLGFIGLIRDITDKLKVEKEKEEIKEQLYQAQKMESIGTLAGGIAHDFNNILASIIGYTELALDEVEKDTTIEESLKEIYAAGARAKDLVRQILTISRHDKKEIKPIQVAPLIKEALKMLRSTIPTSIEFHENICSDPLVVQADPTHLHQVIVNLVTNARHAMAGETGMIEASVDTLCFEPDDIKNKYPDLRAGNYARITVSDNGSGIPKKYLEKIFDPYFTSKEKGEGTGLGLSVVHGIVKSHNGHITVYSEPGKGTAFHVYLPLVKKMASADMPDRPADPLPTGKEHVLLIDDEPQIVKVQQQNLERLGYTVTTITNSVEALAAFRATPDRFDLIITDMAMPNMTGDRLAMGVKAIRSHVPLILCTGFSEKINGNSENLNIDGFLMKPFDKVKIAQTVRKVLDEAKGKSCIG